MNKTTTEFLYGKTIKDATDCFENKMNALKEKFKDYLELHDVDFSNSYSLEFNSTSAAFKVTNEIVSHKMGSEIEKAFYDCFSPMAGK